MSLARPLTAGQADALLYFHMTGSGAAPSRLRPASITTLLALGYLTQNRETRDYSVTEAGRLVCERMRKESS